ncbi:MAG: ABC transporter substrate-binding protein [Spirochaetaceae bacterium]|nr:ABC transporter substrate-binding protein [Spirochaetaceae bacterium]
MNSKKIFKSLVALALASTMLFANGTKEEKKPNSYKVGVSKLLPHPALDAVEKGLQDYLNSTDLEITYDLQNANGDISTAASIASQLKSEKVDVAVGIATPSAQALGNIMKDIPVVFSAVTNPESAGLTGENYAGLSDITPVESQIKLLIQLTGATSIGNIYTSGEANGIELNKMVQEACAKLGVECVSGAVSNSSEVKMATQSIISRIDAMYIAPDNSVASAFSSVSDVCYQYNVPLMGSDPSASKGFNYLVSWGFNYYNIGIATGKVVERILKGEIPGDIGTVVLSEPADFELWINEDMATKLNINIPQELKDTATVIVKNGVENSKI